jgi:putative SOS response-associated peptidase YedK
MCGIASNTKPKKAIEDRFAAKFSNLDFSEIIIAKAFANDSLPIIGQGNTTAISLMEWGLLPAWVNNESQIKQIRAQTINARSETIFEKPSFKENIFTKKCLVLVDGFIEYQHNGKDKQAFYIQLSHKNLFAMAGIYSVWQNAAHTNRIASFSIVTVPANELMSEIHNSKMRMPLILTPEEEQPWLNAKTEKEITSFFKPFHTDLMQAYPIDNKIGKPNADKKNKSLLDQITTIKQGSLF